MKLKITDENLVRLLKDRIDNADADELAWYAEAMFGNAAERAGLVLPTEDEEYLIETGDPVSCGLDEATCKEYLIVEA